MSGIETLLSISDEILKKFLHAVIDDLIQVKKITYNAFYTEIEWPREQFLTAVKWSRDLYQNAASVPDFEMSDEIKEFDASKQECLKQCYNTREREICDHFIKLRLAEKSTLITDFDWKMSLVLGTSKLAELVEPMAQIKLQAADNVNDELVYRNIDFECDVNELNMFVDALDDAIKKL